MSESIALYRAALKGDWIAAEKLLVADRSLITTRITDGGETAMHIAAAAGHQFFVSKLLEMMEEDELGTLNTNGNTALCSAAEAGNTHIVGLMVIKSSSLPKIKGENGVRPLYMAAQQGFHEMADFLYPLSDFGSWTFQEKIDLLTAAICSGLYGLAINIVKQDQALAVGKDTNGETPLLVLARNPLAFLCNNRQGLWLRIIRTVLRPYMKSNTHEKESAAGSDACALLKCLWDAAEMRPLQDIEAAAAKTLELIFVAAESGNDVFLLEPISRDPNFLDKMNESNHTIFHIAVMRRYDKVFNLIYEFGGIKDMIAARIDTDGNNMLHLAAKLAPQDQLNSVPGGAAVWMQREVLWYKGVEKLVQRACRNKKNRADQTPHQLFMMEHQDLMKAGEKDMKQTAKGCMVFAIFVSATVFMMAFTMPGGYDSTGVPTLKTKKLFTIFPVSVAVACLSSLTSVLMFFSIGMSRFSNEDFLITQPLRLLVGVASLFVSIVAMLVAFCTSLLFYEHGWTSVMLLLVFFGSVPTIFVILKYPLFMNVLRCSYSCKWLFRSHNRFNF